MELFIDGFNVMKRVWKLHGDVSKAKQRQFISLIAEYNRDKKRPFKKVWIVFDGGTSRMIEKERLQGVEVVHAGHQYTADEVLVSLAAETYGMLISDDRELLGFFKEQGGEVVRVAPFWSAVMSVLEDDDEYEEITIDESVYKYENDDTYVSSLIDVDCAGDDQELCDLLLSAEVVDNYDEDDDEEGEVKPVHQKRSKKQRAHDRLISLLQ